MTLIYEKKNNPVIRNLMTMDPQQRSTTEPRKKAKSTDFIGFTENWDPWNYPYQISLPRRGGNYPYQISLSRRGGNYPYQISLSRRGGNYPYQISLSRRGGNYPYQISLSRRGGRMVEKPRKFSSIAENEDFRRSVENYRHCHILH